MKDELFEELVASVREGGAILRGQKKPARVFVVDGPDVKEIRSRYGLSQNEFAAMLAGVSPRKQRGARATDMEIAGGTGSETGTDHGDAGS